MAKETTNEELEAKKEKLQMERLKEYFRNVISKQDFNYEEYAQKSAEWKKLTGSDFEFDVLLDKSKQDVLRSDDAIVKNITAIDGIYEEAEVKKHVDEVVKKANEQIEILDEDGKKVEPEHAHDLLSSLMLVSMQEVEAMYADSKKFSRMSKENQRKSLLDDIDVSFHLKAATAVAASAMDMKADEKENARKSQAAVEQYMSGKKVSAKKDHIINGVSGAVLKIKEKIAKFKESGLVKAASRMKQGLENFVGWFNKKNLGAMKDGVVQDVKTNPAQWITNTAVAVGAFGATFASAPVALGAVATYAAYTAISTPLWNLNRKRNTELRKDVAFAKFVKSKNYPDNYLADLAKNDKKAFEELSQNLSAEFDKNYYPALQAEYKGWKGVKKAWKEIHANAEEKKTFNRQWGIATGVGIVSAGVIGALAPSVVEAAHVGGEFATAASTNALTMTRMGTGLARVLGANANATCAYVDANKQFKKTQSAEDKARRDAARASLAVTAILTGAMETVAVSGALAHASANPEIANIAPTDDNSPILADLQNGQYSLVDHLQNQENAPSWLNGYQPADVPAAEVEVPAAPTVTIPTEYNAETMGITEREWGYIHTQVTPMYVANFDETYLNTVNTMQAHPDIFVHPDGSAMTTEQTMWEASRIMALAKARPDGHGGLIARFWDPDGTEVYANGKHEFFYDKAMTKPVDKGIECLPRCHGDEETVKAFQAIYKMINCGEEVKEFNGARIKQFFDETMANGQYKGKGWNIGQTHNYMDRDGCGDIHWVRGKAPAAPVEKEVPVVEDVKGPQLDTVEIKDADNPVQPVRGKALGTIEQETKVTEFKGSSLEGDSQNYYGRARGGSVRQGTLNGSKVTVPLTKGNVNG